MVRFGRITKFTVNLSISLCRLSNKEALETRMTFFKLLHDRQYLAFVEINPVNPGEKAVVVELRQQLCPSTQPLPTRIVPWPIRLVIARHGTRPVERHGQRNGPILIWRVIVRVLLNFLLHYFIQCHTVPNVNCQDTPHWLVPVDNEVSTIRLNHKTRKSEALPSIICVISSIGHSPVTDLAHSTMRSKSKS